jgi:UDP-perosamine 4-acetyltransferase
MRGGRDLVVLGTGGHASVVIDLARAAGFSVKGCLGPAAPSFPADFAPYLGADETLGALDPASTLLALGMADLGSAALRRRLVAQAAARGFRFGTLIHPSAVIASSADLAEGAQVMACAVIQPFATIASHAVINTAAVIEHHCRIGAFAHVAPGAVVCGGVAVGEGAHVGAGATVHQNLVIGAEAVIGLGAAVIRSVEARARVTGVPAKP